MEQFVRASADLVKDERERRRDEQEREWEASYAKYVDTWATHDGNARARAFSKISSDEDSDDDEQPRAFCVA